MNKRNFHELIENKWSEGKFVCVGLDSSDGPRMRAIADACGDLVFAFKLNMEFYFSKGSSGLDDLRYNIAFIHKVVPDVPIIFDRKAADVANTSIKTAEFAFDFLKVDAITVNPYFGREALQPFLDRADKGIFVLCRTSNPGAGEFQDLPIFTGVKLYQRIARNIAYHWNKNYNCGVVVGATYPDELREIRKIVGDMPILIPGVGFQTQDKEPIEETVRKVVEAGKDSRGKGMIINSSRGIIFAENPREETLKLHNQIVEALK